MGLYPYIPLDLWHAHLQGGDNQNNIDVNLALQYLILAVARS